MHKYLALLFAATCLTSFASDPDVTITTKSVYNGFATVAGKVASTSTGLIGVSVDNGGIRYSTLADPSGVWAIVFRHGGVNFTVRAWTVENSTEIALLNDKLKQ